MTAAAAMRLGPFELIEPLGGGMGIVYRARRQGDPRELALKLLRQERLLDGDARARFARELAAMQRLSHPGICPLLEAGEIDGLPFLCMPLLRGQTLAAHIDSARRRGAGAWIDLPGRAAGSPPWAHVVLMLAKVADALHAAHCQGLVHRDVKPANVMIDEAGEPVLLDFGLARDQADRYRELTRTGQVVGTPTYMSPEQLDRRLGAVDARADVYGLGAVLYEALTLVPPHAGDTRAELFANILAGPPVDPRRRRPDLPPELVVLLEVAMGRSKRDRYASAAALADDLRRLSRGELLAARRPSLPRRALRWLRRRQLPVACAAMLLAACVLLAKALVRVVEAAGSATALAAERDGQVWAGRLELARNTYQELPPPWPRHRPALTGWLADHGLPLLQAPGQAERASPGLRAFAAAAVAEVEQRLAWASVVQARSVAMHAARWARVRVAVAADARFAGLDLLPQTGLVPLGADSRSGLQEFYDLGSGDPDLPLPERGEDGRLVLALRHGIVFVLLPGRPYLPLGHQQHVRLAPFLLGKHELTRAQHARLDRGNDPSRWPLGTVVNGEQQTARHPVDQVCYSEVVGLLRRWGLELSTEVQWEYAAVADGPEEPPTPPGNYAQRDTAPAGNGGPEDHFVYAAPVGSFGQNGFGLCDMLGNLSELCADAFDSQQLAARPGDGLRSAGEGEARRVVRGGSFYSVPWPVSARGETWADQRQDYEGVRAMRRVERP